MKTVIRDMSKADLDRAGQILFDAFSSGASKHGYAPRMLSAQEGTSWAWAMLRHGPSEILIAEADGRVAGICCLNPRGTHGGIGPVAVDPALQGNGIGRRLMNALLKKAEHLQSVRLFQEAFNPSSFSLYYSLDFMPVADMADLYRDPGMPQAEEACGKINVVSPDLLDAACAYDRARSKLDRLPDLAYFMRWGKVFVYQDRSLIRGILACLPGSRSVQLGPLVADGEDEAARLYHHAVSVYGDRQCQTRVMVRDRSLVRMLEGLGFKLYCVNLFMVRGAWRPGHSVEAFGRFPEGA